MDTKALRQKILDLAIRGKLVPQDPNDEPASVLLERIRAEKQQMVKDGKLKAKDIKNDTVIFKGDDNLHYEQFQDGTVKCIEDEIPFELPDGWAWTRIGNIASVRGGKRIPKGMSFSNEKTSHAYIRVTDMKNHTVNVSDLKYIDDDVFSKIKNYIVEKNDLYITIAGTIGAVGEIPDELEGMNLTENAVRVTEIKINKSFLCLMMQSNLVQNQFKYKTYQVAMPKLGLERILTTLIPICGFKTQQKICASEEQIKQLTNILDCEYGELHNTITVLKSKILDLATRGKLVPQDPNDEPASVLLERIRAEKEELVKQGKIKRDKKESVIFKGDDNSYYRTNGKIIELCDNLPFELPEGWIWASLGQYCEKVTDQVASGSFAALRENVVSLKEPSYALMVKTADFSNDFTKNLTYTDKHGYEFLQNSNLFGGELVLSNIGSIGKVFIVPDLNCKMTLAPNSVMIRLTNNEYRDYLYYFLQSPTGYEELKAISTGVAMLKFNKTDLKTIYFPLPPFAEQKRIVSAIETVFAQLDEITNSIS